TATPACPTRGGEPVCPSCGGPPRKGCGWPYAMDFRAVTKPRTRTRYVPGGSQPSPEGNWVSSNVTALAVAQAADDLAGSEPRRLTSQVTRRQSTSSKFQADSFTQRERGPPSSQRRRPG